MGKLRFIVPLIVFANWATAARADDIPTVNVNQGTAIVTVSPDVVGNLAFSFSGPGFAMSGMGTVTDCGFCVHLAPPGLGPLSGFNTITNSGPNIGSFTLGSVVFDNVLFHGLVTIASSTNFNLPNAVQSTFTITLPVTFSGQLMACPVTSDLNGCASADIATFNFEHLHGKVKIDFSSSGGLYTFDKAVYTISPVPEPTTITLVGAGAVLMWFRRYRRSVQQNRVTGACAIQSRSVRLSGITNASGELKSSKQQNRAC